MLWRSQDFYGGGGKEGQRATEQERVGGVSPSHGKEFFYFLYFFIRAQVRGCAYVSY